MSSRIAVVILNWNTKKFLEQFLPGVINHSGSLAEIIVADNASTDDSVEFLEKNYPDIRVIRNERNDGFTGGYNTALKKVDAEFYLLLNSDVEVTSNWLHPLLKLMDTDTSIGACQPKILSYAEPEKFEYAGAGGGYIDKFGYPFCRGRIFNSIEKDQHQYDDNREVFWATGACMMVRASVFHKLNGFDPLFFAHMEEIDLCWRMRLAGHKVFYCGESVVYHVGGGTLHKSNPRKTFLNFRNNLLMIYKNTSPEKRSYVLATRSLLDFAASMKFLLTGNKKDFKAVWSARKDFNALKSRYSGQVALIPESREDAGFFIYPKSILVYYYLYGRRKFSSLNWNSSPNR